MRHLTRLQQQQAAATWQWLPAAGLLVQGPCTLHDVAPRPGCSSSSTPSQRSSSATQHTAERPQPHLQRRDACRAGGVLRLAHWRQERLHATQPHHHLPAPAPGPGPGPGPVLAAATSWSPAGAACHHSHWQCGRPLHGSSCAAAAAAAAAGLQGQQGRQAGGAAPAAAPTPPAPPAAAAADADDELDPGEEEPEVYLDEMELEDGSDLAGEAGARRLLDSEWVGVDGSVATSSHEAALGDTSNDEFEVILDPFDEFDEGFEFEEEEGEGLRADEVLPGGDAPGAGGANGRPL